MLGFDTFYVSKPLKPHHPNTELLLQRLAKNVATLRTAQGLSTRVLAQQCHIARMTIQNIEAGVSGSRVLSVLDSLAHALGVSTASLLATEPQPRGGSYFEVRQSLAANVRMARETLEWSQTKLEHHSGVNRSMIARIEQGDRNPSLDTVVRLASAMNISVERLLDR